jgi:hypothetical protein
MITDAPAFEQRPRQLRCLVYSSFCLQQSRTECSAVHATASRTAQLQLEARLAITPPARGGHGGSRTTSSCPWRVWHRLDWQRANAPACAAGAARRVLRRRGHPGVHTCSGLTKAAHTPTL